jgi:hypothetical protein
MRKIQCFSSEPCLQTFALGFGGLFAGLLLGKLRRFRPPVEPAVGFNKRLVYGVAKSNSWHRSSGAS